MRKISTCERQELLEAERLRYRLRAFALTGFGPLPIAEMERIAVVLAGCQCGADGGIHASGKADHGARRTGVR